MNAPKFAYTKGGQPRRAGSSQQSIVLPRAGDYECRVLGEATAQAGCGDGRVRLPFDRGPSVQEKLDDFFLAVGRGQVERRLFHGVANVYQTRLPTFHQLLHDW